MCISSFYDNSYGKLGYGAIECVQFADGTIWNIDVLLDKARYVDGPMNVDDPNRIDGYSYQNDILTANDNDNSIKTYSGDDVVYAFGGNDTIDTGEGDDIIDPGTDTTLHTDAISSLRFSRLISRTPCVARPIIFKSATFIRIVIPDLLMIIKSFSSVTFLMSINLPVFSVTWIVLTPFPPRLVIR